MRNIEAAYKAVDQDTAEVVSKLISDFGVPPTLDAAEVLARELYPVLLHRRREMWAKEAALIVSEHPNFVIPEPRQYPVTALTKLIRNCAGLSAKPRLMQLELFDPETIAMQTKRVAPAWLPDDNAVVVEMKRRLVVGVARHVKQASRSLVFDTAAANNVRFARRLTGQENCAFCALMASRGAVYTTARKAGGLGNQFHDHCDCWIELVPDPDRWEGREEADHYHAMWFDGYDGHHSNAEDFREFRRRFKEEQSKNLLNPTTPRRIFA